ncbi:hypothetical protein TWF569_011034 [Orbilia oligospora]|uniref:DNA-directed RNA polymerase subunit n=2 Tax=Orbilia oligospora TaxID=2813651 RepID=A0A7C8JNY3_ORBOL|nr:hypothetical protein TWF706_008588 [Orbilia oligospora]KAF3096033.1 hypothetical protein TWF103_009941 [Orbilia oligospora]KAF3129803.1 hypothetical protein TWF703_008541 [Orbilia oligospora]KAF3131863.1 hypothetical protein TWF569_011034 [Orbilia oligospora]KAF3131982.1 hypothetical protein TWF594_009687 [Orbilia oligospora]
MAEAASTSYEKSHKKHKIKDAERTDKSERTNKKRKLGDLSEAPLVEKSAPRSSNIGPPMPSLQQTVDHSSRSLKSAEISSPYALTTASRYLSISPAYSATPQTGIQRDHLDPLVFKYDSTLDGVILLHQNLRFQSPAAKILGESPFAFVWCLVEFVLWKPTVGMVLEGYVNNVSPSHLGMLYGNVFSVSVTQAGIPQDWKFVAAKEDDASLVIGAENDPYSNVGRGRREKQKPVGGTDPIEGLTKAMGRWFDLEGNEVEGLRKFVVTAVKAEGGMLSLEGSFRDEDVPEIIESEPEHATTTEAPKRRITQLYGKDSDDEESRRRRKEKKEKKKRKREGKTE